MCLLSRSGAASRSYPLGFVFGSLARADRIGFVPAVAMINVDAPAKSFPGDHADCAGSLSRFLAASPTSVGLSGCLNVFHIRVPRGYGTALRRGYATRAAWNAGETRLSRSSPCPDIRVWSPSYRRVKPRTVVSAWRKNSPQPPGNGSAAAGVAGVGQGGPWHRPSVRARRVRAAHLWFSGELEKRVPPQHEKDAARSSKSRAQVAASSPNEGDKIDYLRFK